MFKNTSNNTQSREVRKVVNSTRNTAGIDPDAIRGEQMALDNEKERLGQEKRELEHKLQAIAASIIDAQRKGNWTGVAKWKHQKAEISGRVHAIDNWMSKIRADRRALDRAEQTSREQRYERVFIKVAKEILSEEVYRRVVTATIHRLEDRQKDLRGANAP